MAHLLVPIKDEGDIIAGACFARSLINRHISVKVNLLHIALPAERSGSFVSFLKGSEDAEEKRANALIKHAARHLIEQRIPYSTFILWGRVVPAILDAAVMLDCHAIVLPVMKQHRWTRLRSGDVVRKVVKANGSVPVVMVEPDGRVLSISGATADQLFLQH